MGIFRRISQNFIPREVDPNQESLATRILNDATNDSFDNIEGITEIVNNENFKYKPIDYLFRLMIERGILGNQPSDSARQYVIKKIPNFAQTLGSRDFLEKSAKDLFANSDNKAKKIEVLKSWLSKEPWKQSYAESLRDLDEHRLRMSLYIYKRAENLQPPIEAPKTFQESLAENVRIFDF